MLRIILFLCLGLHVIFPSLSLAQADTLYEVTGHVLDEESMPYKHLEVRIFQLERSTFTDDQGRFSFHRVPNGVYALVFLHPYGEIYKTLTVDNDDTEYDLVLRREIKFDEIVVKAVRSWNGAPYTKERIDGEALQQKHYGQDVPQLLAAQTSVVATSDAGTGIGYTGLRIRGIDPGRINVTLNGIPWNDPESHAVYWVDLPDLVNSVSDLEIQRGVGSSTGGTGAFGSGISINTNKLRLKPYANLQGTLGAFGTRKGGVRLGSGLIEGQYTIDGGISQLNSEGYIDRSHAKLRGLYLSGTKITPTSSLRFNLMNGQEVTGLAWYGVPRHYAETDDLRTFNSAGTERSLEHPYDSTVDNYAQTHLQLFYNKSLNRENQLAFAFFYTRGKGFYEQFRAQQTLLDYGVVKPDTPVADIIRRKWLANHLAGMTYHWHHKGTSTPWKLILGGVSSAFFGDHFGTVARIPAINILPESSKLPHRYYDNSSDKYDLAHYAKLNYPVLRNLNAYAELQYRYLHYTFQGFDRDRQARDTTVVHHFIQPKLGLSMDIGPWHLYSSFAQAAKEPTRSDYRDAGATSPPKPEHLDDLEGGIAFHGSALTVSLNAYYMRYKDQLALTGKISDVGEYIRVNIPQSYRRGIELSLAGRGLGMKWSANGTWSQNRAKSFTEYIDNWDTGKQEKRIHNQTDLAFSPGLIGGVSLSYPFTLMGGAYEAGLDWKYVGKQYLDNTRSGFAALDPYQYLNATFGYQWMKGRLKNLSVRLHLINLLNSKYASGGWVYRFYTTHPDWISAKDQPALTDEGKGYYNLSGLYPQATRHWMLTIGLKF